MIGTSLHQYQITAKLGAGGMGEVYRARDTRLGRDVAIKLLPRSWKHDSERLVRFEREAQLLASLNHPHIGSIHGFEQHEGTHFLVLELIEGETLEERLKRGALPVREAMEVCRQIAEALESAHQKGIIHRDLKPANIKFTNGGKVKVLDFGLAKALSESADPDQTTKIGLTLDGSVLGSPAYMSPEQASGKVVDEQSDIWSFGCILYECLTGERLFGGKTITECLSAVLQKEVDWSRLPKETPSAVEQLLRHSLERDQGRRSRQIDSAVANLEQALADVRLGRRTQQRITFVGAAITGALTILLVVAAFWFWPTRTQSPASNSTPSRISSMAVRPLDDFTPESQAYLCDGMTEALTAALANISALRVPPRSTVMRYKSSTKSVREIARELQVDALVEGSVQRVGNRMVITVKLIEAATEQQLWHATYERELSDFFNVQREVVKAVVSEVAARLTPQEANRLTETRPLNPDAVEAYLKGVHHANQWTSDGTRAAIHHLEKATGIEPQFAEAYAALGYAYVVAGYLIMQPSVAFLQAEAAAKQAARLDNKLSAAHSAIAVAKLHLYDWAGAESAFEEALRLAENDAMAHDWYGWFHLARGRTNEAVAHVRRALQLEPDSILFNPDLAYMLLFNRRYQEALEQSQETLKLDKANLQAHETLAWAHILQSEYERGIEILLKARELDDSPNVQSHLARAYAQGNRREDAMRLLRQLETERNSSDAYVGTDWIAKIYAALGMNDEAFEWLHRAVEEKAPGLLWIKVAPSYDPLRNDPRFDELLKRLRLHE